MMPLLFDLSFPGIVENKLAWLLDLLKVLKDVAPTSAYFCSQYSINSRFGIPETVWNFTKLLRIFNVSGNILSIIYLWFNNITSLTSCPLYLDKGLINLFDACCSMI